MSFVGDDCIAVNDGSTFINATRVTCGPGHGIRFIKILSQNMRVFVYLYSSRISYKYEFHELISVGSLGRNRTTEKVSDVHVRNCTFTGTTNGARIKTVEVSVTDKVKYMFIL